MIRFDHVSKQFTMRYENSRTFQDIFVKTLGKLSGTAPRSARPSAVKILDDVSFTVGGGEALGIIGPNGAGKSTILKLAAGIIYPDTGRISIEGRVAGLLELGAGFHPDLSGRENIYLYGSIMGLSRKTIETRLAEIVEFAGLSHFIDIPVRDYSSGMFMRLAFAVAIHVDANILLIDEVLSVGDAGFRQKSYRRILDYKSKGGTILFVSHELTTVERLCGRALLLDNGHIMAEGSPREVIEEYLQLLRFPRQNGQLSHSQDARWQVRIKAVRLLNASGAPCDEFSNGSPALLRIWLEANAPVSDLVVQAQIYDAGSAGGHAGTMAHGTNSARHSLSLDMLPGEICIEVAYQSLNLIPGSYYFRVGILPYEWAPEYYDVWHGVCPFEVSGSRELGAGLALLPHRWRKVGD
jgi:ABC-type polysaccharide/polyol phosphate transport system ATPase subunit